MTSSKSAADTLVEHYLKRYFGGYEWVYDSDRFQGPYKEFDRDSLHTIMSVTKAFTSALVGIAVDQGFIANEHEKVFDYFPEYAHLRDGRKNDITLEHLLTMTSGLEWNEWEYSLGDTQNDLIQLFIVNDPIAYILAKPVVHQPGTYWYYSGGDVNYFVSCPRPWGAIWLPVLAENLSLWLRNG